MSTRSCDLVQNLAFPCFIKGRIHTKRPLYINCTSSRIAKWYLRTQTTSFIDCYRYRKPGKYLPDPLVLKYLRITGLLADSKLTHAAGLHSTAAWSLSRTGYQLYRQTFFVVYRSLCSQILKYCLNWPRTTSFHSLSNSPFINYLANPLDII
jgi:hypothetical protein